MKREKERAVSSFAVNKTTFALRRVSLQYPDGGIQTQQSTFTALQGRHSETVTPSVKTFKINLINEIEAIRKDHIIVRDPDFTFFSGNEADIYPHCCYYYNY